MDTKCSGSDVDAAGDGVMLPGAVDASGFCRKTVTPWGCARIVRRATPGWADGRIHVVNGRRVLRKRHHDHEVDIDAVRTRGSS